MSEVSSLRKEDGSLLSCLRLAKSLYVRYTDANHYIMLSVWCVGLAARLKCIRVEAEDDH